MCEHDAMDFADLYFGHADAKTEAVREPDSFIKSFVNHAEILNSVVDEGRFLVLGPKGAGKSALAWYLKFTENDNQLSVGTRDVSELPIGEVGQLKTGDAPGLDRSLNAWRFLLLCGLIDILLQSEDSPLSKNLQAVSVINKLRDFGFLDPTPKGAVLKATKMTWKVPIPTAGEVLSVERSDSLHLMHLIPYMEKWIVEGANKDIKNLLILDGLDSIYLNDSRYIPAISALVQSALHLNQKFQLAGGAAGVVILIRNDVFSRLELPDGGKIREDWGIDLDWRILSGNASAAPLFDLVDKKAVSSSGLLPYDIVGEHFPNRVILFGRDREIYDYLLNLTRHTPRDILRLLEHIRKEHSAYPRATRTRILRADVIHEGILQYCSKYFVDAIRNELVGRGTSGEVGRVIVDALREVGSRRFDLDEFEASLTLKTNDAEGIPAAAVALRWLFFAGAIGNEIGGTQTRYLQFFHRKDDNDVHLRGKLVMHNALVHAWGLKS